jgi:pimeloyl-ACP methyl ester carboxylesterase
VWDQLVRQMPEGVVIHTVRLPGHGCAAEGMASFAAGVRLVRGLISALDPRPVILVGHSLGANLCVVAASGETSTTTSLVLSSAPFLRAQYRWPYRWATRCSPGAWQAVIWGWSLAKRAICRDSRVPVPSVEGCAGYRQHLYLPLNVDRCRVPTTLIYGARDRFLRPPRERELRRIFSRPVQSHIVDCDHHIPIRAAESISAHVRVLADEAMEAREMQRPPDVSCR